MIAETTSYLQSVQHLPPNGTLLLHNVPWQEYERVLREFENKSACRVYYNNGILKIMSPGFDHEFPKDVALKLVTIYADEKLVTIYADEFDIDFDSYG